MHQDLHRQYAAVRSAPAAARADIVSYLGEAGHSGLAPTAALLVSELVTNSVLHATGPITMHAAWTAGTLRVDIHDTSGELPRPSARNGLGLGRVHGRGLSILSALADDWGVIARAARGKTTWFELDT